jgi:Family of unknown function (DUF6308)
VTASKQSGFRFVFPNVLTRLKWAHRVTPADSSRIELRDIRNVLSWYFSQMTGGARFQQAIQEEWNTKRPNCLVKQNFQAAKQISSMGWGYQKLGHLFGKALPELRRIPPNADLFRTTKYDTDVGNVIDRLIGQPGIQIANATKLLSQKRPRLIPIFDEYARQSFHVPLLDGDVVTPALASIREIAEYKTNKQSLQNLSEWLVEHPTVADGLSLSMLRLMDILAWGVIRQRESAKR